MITQPHNLTRMTEVLHEMIKDYKELQSGDIYKYIIRYQSIAGIANLKRARNLLDHIIKERE